LESYFSIFILGRKTNIIEYPILLDGGLSNQLEELGCNLNNSLWTAEVLRTNPEAIIQAHFNYLEAGAKIITTSSYQATLKGFKDKGLDKVEAEALILKSVELARVAIERYSQKYCRQETTLVAASIGPFGAYLADGSEYRGNYTIHERELFDFHEAKIRLLDSASVDLLAFETIPSFSEAKIIAAILESTATPSWISFSCRDEEHICDGTPIAECTEMLKAVPGIWATGVNCTRPGYVKGLIQKIKNQGWEKKIIVYPNSGEKFNAENKSWENSRDILDNNLVEEWLEAGADIIGGCCRVGPQQISAMNKVLISRKRF
jgi:homocysteine S-methyltransferase